MRRVPLLPQKFERPHKRPRPHFPTVHVGPLVDEHGQVAVGRDPLGKHVVDDGFRGGAHDERFIKFFAAATRDEGQFGGEAVDVVGFLFKERKRDELREISVVDAFGFERGVKPALNRFPQSVAVRPNDHRPPHRPIVS
jgi:hypothetical protein